MAKRPTTNPALRRLPARTTLSVMSCRTIRPRVAPGGAQRDFGCACHRAPAAGWKVRAGDQQHQTDRPGARATVRSWRARSSEALHSRSITRPQCAETAGEIARDRGNPRLRSASDTAGRSRPATRNRARASHFGSICSGTTRPAANSALVSVVVSNPGCRTQRRHTSGRRVAASVRSPLRVENGGSTAHR